MTAYAGNIWTVALYPETTFGNGPEQDSTTWDASGDVVEFLCIEPNPAGLRQGDIEDQNYRQRLLGQRPNRRGLKNGSFTCGVYAHAYATSVAEGAQVASADYQSQLLKNAWGGQKLGYAAGLAGGSASAPETEVGEGADLAASQWGFFVDATDGEGEFALIESEASDTLTLRGGFTLSFTPDVGGADTVGAVVAHYFDSDALTNNADANYDTHSFFLKGDGPEDLWEPRGCKVEVSSIEGLEAGSEPLFRLNIMATTFANETLSAPTLSGDPAEDAPPSVGTGSDTSIKLGDHGSALGDLEESQITINAGITRPPWGGPSGLEGRHGYFVADEGTTVEITVPYDNVYRSEYLAGTRKHLLVQVGSTAGEAVGWYFPRLEYLEDPERGTDEERATVTLRFRALEHDGTTSLTGDDLELYRSRMVYLRSVTTA